MADFWSGWDPSGRYRIRVRIWETGGGSGKAWGQYDIALFSNNAGTYFYGYNTSGYVNIDGTRHWTHNGVNPGSAWNGANGVMLGSGSWGPTNGNRWLSIDAGFNATAAGGAFGPTGIMYASGGINIGGGSAATVPGAVGNTVIDNIGPHSARITWWAPSNGGSAINNYGLYVSTMNSPTPTGAAHIAYWDYTGNIGQVTLNNLWRNTRYYAFVRAQNGVGWGGYSPVNSFQTNAYEPPSAPTNYGVSDVTSETAYTTMPLVADMGGMQVSNLQIQVGRPGSTTEQLTTYTAGGYRTVLMKGLQAGTDYDYRMRVYNAAPGGGWGPWGSWVRFKTLANTPSAPQNLTITKAGTGVIVRWDPPADLRGSTLQSYYLRMSSNDAFSGSLHTFAVGPTVTSFYVEDVADGNWWFQAWTITNNGVGTYTEPKSFSTGNAIGSSLQVNVGGKYRPGTMWAKINGVWKPGTLWANRNGTWKP